MSSGKGKSGPKASRSGKVKTDPDAYTIGDQLVIFNVDTKEHAMTFPGFGINSDCHCTEASPEPDCDAYYWVVHYSTLCRNLHLTPGEPIFNQENQEVDVLYAWYPESIGGGGEDRCDYPREQEEFDSDPDKLAWYEYAGATVRMDLQTGVVKSGHITKLNTKLTMPFSKMASN